MRSRPSDHHTPFLTFVALLTFAGCGGGGDQTAQENTVSDIRNVGQAMMAWMNDELSAPAAGQQMIYFDNLLSKKTLTHAEITEILKPGGSDTYIGEVPEFDGWGHPYEFAISTEDLLGVEGILGVRSPGRDGVFDNRYVREAYSVLQYDQDIVWMDGFWVAWPQGLGG